MLFSHLWAKTNLHIYCKLCHDTSLKKHPKFQKLYTFRQNDLQDRYILFDHHSLSLEHTTSLGTSSSIITQS